MNEFLAGRRRRRHIVARVVYTEQSYLVNDVEQYKEKRQEKVGQWNIFG